MLNTNVDYSYWLQMWTTNWIAARLREHEHLMPQTPFIPVPTNHTLVPLAHCTMHSLQSKCTCELFYSGKLTISFFGGVHHWIELWYNSCFKYARLQWKYNSGDFLQCTLPVFQFLFCVKLAAQSHRLSFYFKWLRPSTVNMSLYKFQVLHHILGSKLPKFSFVHCPKESRDFRSPHCSCP